MKVVLSASAWLTPPAGHVGVGEAARRLGVTRQAVYKMLQATPPRLEARRISHANGRSRVWIATASLDRFLVRREDDNRSSSQVVSSPTEDAQANAILLEREQWRARALRAEAAHIERSLADADLAAAMASRSEAEQHLRAHAAALQDALDHTTSASDHYRSALDAFTLPADVGDVMET